MKSDTVFTSYLLNLDDESFFAVYRNYLGPVQTPYNKHDLIQELQDFLVRPVTGERIRRLISQEDALLLSAVHVLRTPTEEQLYRFLSGEMEYALFQASLLNLKDRLLVIQNTTRGDTIQINPLLEEALAPLNIGMHYLIGGQNLPSSVRTEPVSQPWLSPDFLVALYAFLREFPEPFTRSGTMRKKVSAAVDERFGTYFQTRPAERYLRFAVSTCETLGLVNFDDETQAVRLRPDSWDAFLSELPERWVRYLLWGAALTGTVERSFEYAELLLEALSAIPATRSYSVGEVVRLLQLSGNGLSLPIDGETVQRLLSLGVLVALDGSGDEESVASREDEGSDESDGPHLHRVSRLRINPTITAVHDRPTARGGVRVHANMEITVAPGSDIHQAWTIASFSRLVRYDTVPTYILTDESVADARREGVENVLALMSETTDDIPQNVRFLLKRWESRSRAVRLIRGLVVIAGEEEGEILKKSEDFLSSMREEIAPNVFLFNLEDEARVEKLLRKIDIGSTPTVETARVVDVNVPEYQRYLLRHQQPALRSSVALRAETGDPAGPIPLHSTIREELMEQLNGETLPEEVRQEIALRIDRGLIIFPQQIRKDIVPQHGIEVRGLDYLGKIRMIEQAISNGDILEVITRSGSGSPQRILVKPREVVENAGDLMLRAIRQPDGPAVKIRIRRISVLRRLSGTLINRKR